MPYYGFRLDEIHSIYQRGKQPDVDVVLFAGSVNDGQWGRGISGTFGGMVSGERVPAEDVAPTIQGKFGLQLGGWIVGPFPVEDGDKITLSFMGYNKSDIPDPDHDFDKAELAGLDALIGYAAGGAAGALAAAGGLAALGGDLLGSVGGYFSGISEKLLGFSDPQVLCNGTVFQYTEDFQASELAQLDYSPNPVGFGQIAYTKSFDDSANHPSECGHTALTEVTYSILQFPEDLSIAFYAPYVWPSFNLSRGLRQLAPGQSSTSIRDLLLS